QMHPDYPNIDFDTVMKITREKQGRGIMAIAAFAIIQAQNGKKEILAILEGAMNSGMRIDDQWVPCE
ncbi:MAG: hypothetical protein ACTSXP_10490, partial [Promethearchaeota archaeon]